MRLLWLKLHSLKQLRRASKSQLFALLALKQPVDRGQFDAAVARLEANGFVSVDGETLTFVP